MTFQASDQPDSGSVKFQLVIFCNRDSTDEIQTRFQRAPAASIGALSSQETSAMQSCWNGSFGSSPYTMSTIWQPMLLKAGPMIQTAMEIHLGHGLGARSAAYFEVQIKVAG